MGTNSTDVRMSTRALQNESAVLIKQLQQVITKLADIPKSQDNTKQTLRESLCKSCRDKAFELFQSPFKSYSNAGCQTECQLFRSEAETYKSDQNEDEQSIPHRKKVMEPSEKIEKLELLIQEVQDRERKTVAHLQDELNTRDMVIKSLREEKEKQTLLIQTLKEERQNAEQKEQDLRNQLSESEAKRLQLENQTGRQDNCGYYLRSQENKDKQTLVEQLQQENASLKQNIDHLNKRVANLKVDVQKAMSENETLINKNDQMTKEKEDIRLMMNQCEQEKNQIQHKVKNYEEVLTQRKLRVETAEKRNRNLTETLTRRDDELRSLTTTKDTIHSKYEHVKKEKCNIQHELDELKAKAKREKSNITDTQKQNLTLTDTLDERNREVTFLKQEKDQICSQMRRIQQEKDEIKRVLDEQQEKMDELKEQIRRIRNENRNLADSLSSRDEELRSMETEKHKLKSQMEEEIARLKSSCDKQREELRQSNQEIEELKKPRKKRIVLGLRSERSGLGKSLVDMVTREMTTRLQKRLDVYNLNLVVSFSQISSEVTNGFQIALCLNMSRVGTNIVDSIKGMKVDRDLFVMVLHHTNKENLSSLTPTSHRVTGSEVRQLGGILDMAFSSDSGLYDCDLNNAAMEKIAIILKKCLIL